MSAYNNNEPYGTTGTTGGLGVSTHLIYHEKQLCNQELTKTLQSNTAGTNTYGTSTGLGSDSRRDDIYDNNSSNHNKTTSGPHNSDVLNKLDPRVDSDNSKAYDSNNTSTGYGSHNTSGPHSSDLSNRADPRVDSDNSRLGGSHNTTGLGSTGTTTGEYGSSNAYDNNSAHKTTSGPHKSDLLNKADPRVDSDNSKAYGSSTHNTSSGLGSSTTHNTGAGFGTTGATTGPHSTDTANALDPHVDSSRSGYTGSNTTTSGLDSTGTTSGAYGSTNSGPHSSNLANKADPRVDSDNDRTRGPDSTRDNYGVSRSPARFLHLPGKKELCTDMKQSSGLGSTGTTTGAYGSTKSGPHSSNLANKADPRVDSDNDRTHGPDSHNNYGVSSSQRIIPPEASY